jgi:plasmid maintenance system antidote protein VapI
MKETGLEVHTDLKILLKQAQCTHRDMAVVLGIHPSTLNNHLNGYSPLPSDLKIKIEDLAKRRIELLKERRKELEHDLRKKKSEVLGSAALSGRSNRSDPGIEQILRRIGGEYTDNGRRSMDQDSD